MNVIEDSVPVLVQNAHQHFQKLFSQRGIFLVQVKKGKMDTEIVIINPVVTDIVNNVFHIVAINFSIEISSKNVLYQDHEEEKEWVCYYSIIDSDFVAFQRIKLVHARYKNFTIGELIPSMTFYFGHYLSGHRLYATQATHQNVEYQYYYDYELRHYGFTREFFRLSPVCPEIQKLMKIQNRLNEKIVLP